MEPSQLEAEFINERIKQMDKIMLGDFVRDTVTRFSGVVMSDAEYMYNCRRILVQPRELKDGAVQDSVWFDDCQLEFVENTDLKIIPLVPHNVKLGDTVADTLTQFKGKVVAINNFANGCVRIGVHAGRLKDSLPQDEHFIPVQQLKVVAETPTVVPIAKQGGPMRAPNMAKNPR